MAGLLCWLDARSRGSEIALRLEDLDRERTKSGYVEAMERDLAWFGLDWDSCSRQSNHRARHETVLDSLVEEERVYACHCSRSEIRSIARSAPDGSDCYPGTCRTRRVRPAEWRGIDRPLRLRLAPHDISLHDESGLDLSGNAAKLFGDPVLRRRDGAYAYHFVSVLDDAEIGVERVVRGRDLAPSTILQAALQHEMGLSTPTYRHHALFLERSGDKLSKFHGAVGADVLRAKYDAATLCGLLASFVGLVPPGTACLPIDLVAEFEWSRVCTTDVEVLWTGKPDENLRLG